jgi:7-cyano-7-deazaguanine synthase in queuosine biosynthesis
MPTAVLFSAGLDSAVLAAAEGRHDIVHAVYVSCGLAWEAEELAAVDRLLATPAFAAVNSVARLTFTARDLYPSTHWALAGKPPAFDTPDEDVYLTGRNVMLLSKGAIYCAQNGIHRIALATLSNNPFPDATPAFFCGHRARAVARPESSHRGCHAVHIAPQERRHYAGRRARCGTGADAVLHEPASRAALRVVQQMS